MRATLKQVVRHPTWLPSWWIELPMCRRVWWSEALFTPGEGWLKWAPDDRVRYQYDPPDMDQWVVFPPAHRVWQQVRWILQIPRLMLREHLSWEEVAPAWECLRADPDRRKDLWR